MTLTTEQLRARAKFWREKAIEAKWESVSIAQDMLLNADAFDELAANREAQPVLYASEETLAYAKEGEKSLVTWSEPMGDAVIPLYTAPPAPEITDEAIDRIVVPLSPDGLDEEKYPCEWHLYHDRERIRKELREYFAAPRSPEELDKYTQGVKDGLEWAARTVEANHPNTGDWLYDDRDDLAKAIRKGPDMLAAAPEGA
ncbi:hypothetical protein AN695_0205895 [Serratia marcescens]|uniref:Eaa protein n=1 Tax=Serratia marcescens TaxID=615 RepID=A0A6H2ZS98_SERMA|nr:hypothetical protein [Serratia marcescens]OCO80412.1 hypothetical protein AN695_0205895 [Serratia marcescens]